MEIRFALLADSANVSVEGKLNVIGIFDRVGAKQFPATHMTSVLVVSLEAHRTEAGPHELRILFVDADGNPLMEMKAGMTFVPPEGAAALIRVNQILPVPMIPLPAPGDYSFDISIDGRYEMSVPINAWAVEG